MAGVMLFNFMTNLGPNAQTYLLAGANCVRVSLVVDFDIFVVRGRRGQWLNRL